ncbi:Uncharacterised protein [uncultured archaeon]|nr:Uncharacterised protein [uncultured archaeon]
MDRRKALGRGVGALFSDPIGQESEVKRRESEVITPLSLVITDESRVGSNESRVITPESRGIINESEVKSKELGVISKKLEVGKENQRGRTGKMGPRSRQKPKGKQMIEAIGRPRVKSVNQEILEQAIAEGLESPRISTWSPLVMSTLRYLQLTTVRFSMSREVSETLEAAFRAKYPELYERIEKELEER